MVEKKITFGILLGSFLVGSFLATMTKATYLPPLHKWDGDGTDSYTTSGSVGIGNTSPSEALDVTGNALVSGNMTVDTNTLYVDATNNRVGIGTTSPNVALEVVGVINATADITLNGSSILTSESDTLDSVVTRNATTTSSITVGGLTVNTNTLHVDTANARVGIGTTSPTEKLEVNGNVLATAYLYSSDARKKDNIETITNALETVQSLRGVTYNWKESGTPSVGVIAQEVEAVLPQLVSTSGVDGMKSVEYGNIVGVLIEAIKEQQDQIEALEARLAQ